MTRLLTCATVVLVGCCGGCSNRPSQGVLLPVAERVEGASRVSILAATTRAPSKADPGEMFGSERAETTSFAGVTVSVPPDAVRKVGDIQWPATPPGDPHRDFVTVSADYLDKRSFETALAAAVRQAGHGKVLVFVHGFNTRFDDAIYRFAQIAHDSKAQAVFVLFTWPSRGEIALRAYTYDRDSATYSRDALEELLDTIARQGSVTDVTVLAHSMGNWLTLETLRSLSIRGKRIGDKIKTVMLVAPDVDVDIFRTQIQRIAAPRPRFELFVSQDDKALALSQFIWGGVPRLGEVDPTQEPYRSEFDRQKMIVFDLTKLRTFNDDAHDRAFEDITSVSAMIRKRLHEGQQIVETPSGALPVLSGATLR